MRERKNWKSFCPVASVTAGHDDGRNFVVEFIAEDATDFDGCAGECESLLKFSGGFDPVDGAFDGLSGP